MTNQVEGADQSAIHFTLPDGTPAIVRPIHPNGGPQLAAELKKLSSDSRYQRFLSPKSSFSSKELNFLTNCDGVNHLALVLAVTDADGREQRSVAVARCVRDSTDASLAEVAITVADAWQRRGVGTILFKELAKRARKVGIKRWRAYFLSDNAGIRNLMEKVGTRQLERIEDYKVTEVIYQFPPSTRAS